MSRAQGTIAALVVGLLTGLTPAQANEVLLDEVLDRGDAPAAFKALCAQIAADPADARVPLLLTELRSHWDLVPGGREQAHEVLTAQLSKPGVAGAPGADPLRASLASLQWALGNRDGARATQAARGFVDSFLVVGPFGVTRNASLHEVFEPEVAANARRVDTKQRFRALRDARRWEPLSRKPLRSSIDLEDVLSGEGNATYLMTHLNAPTAQTVTLVYRGPSAKVWVNRAQVSVVDRATERLDTLLRIPVALQAGWNRLVIKLLGGSEGNFSLRLTNAEGEPLALESSDAPRDVDAVAQPVQSPQPSLFHAALAAETAPHRKALYTMALQRAGLYEEALGVLTDVRSSAPAVAGEAWFLRAYGAAIEQARYLPRASRREQARGAYRALLEKAPTSVFARRRLAEFELQDERRTESIQTLEAILADHPNDVATRLRLFEVLLAAEWTLEAERVLEQTPKAQQELPPVLQARARLLDALDHPLEALAVRERLLELDPSQTWVHLQRMEQALTEGKGRAAQAALTRFETQAEIAEGQGEVRRARVARALGNAPGALAALRKAVEARPWDVGRRLNLAQRLAADAERYPRNTGIREEALANLDAVLHEKPELHAARRLRDALRGTEDRFWEEWAPDVAKVLEGAPEAKHWPQASTVCLFDQQVTRVYPDTSTVDVIHQIWRILDEAGIERYGARPQSGELLRVRTITPAGKTIEPIRASGGTFQMPALSAGAHVEHAFKLESRAAPFQLTGGPFYFQDPDLTEPFWLSRWVILVHKDAPVRVVERNMRRKGIDKSVEVRGDWVAHIYTARNQPRIQPEPGAPNRDEFLPWVKVVEERTLDEIGSFYRERAIGPPVTPSVVAAAEQAIAGVSGDTAQAKALFRFVHEHVVQNTGGFTPAQILAARGGNKAALLLGLLRAAKIPHNLLLAAPEPSDAVDWEHPEPGQFNTPVIRIEPRDGEAFVVFANGHKFAPIDRLPSALRGANAYVCDPLAGRLTTLPDEPMTSDVLISRQEVSLLPEGTVRATVRRTLPPYGLYRLKELFGTLPEKQVRGWFAGQANQLYPGARVLESSIPRREEPGVPLQVIFSLESRGAIRPRGDGRLELRGLVAPSGLKERFGAHRQRVFDLLLRDLWAAGGATDEQSVVKLGPYACPRLPESLTINNRFGQFSIAWSRIDAKTLIVRRHVLLRPGRVAPRQFAEFRVFLEAIDRAERAPLVVELRAQ